MEGEGGTNKEEEREGYDGERKRGDDRDTAAR